MRYLVQVGIIFNILALFFGILFVWVKKRHFGWLIIASFGIKVFFNFASMLHMSVPVDMIYFLSFASTGTIFLALWRIYIRL